MTKYATATLLTLIAVDPAARVPLYQQIYDELRSAILTGRLAPGARLPATRELASALGVARNTVMNAFDQLLAEGYLEGRVGDGTYVTRVLPDDLLYAPAGVQPAPRLGPAGQRLSRQGALLAAAPANPVLHEGPPRVFRPFVPALDSFPIALWAQLTARRYRRSGHSLLSASPSVGYPPLRAAIASYLGAARAVRCEPDQVMIVAGAQQALDLTARVLLDPGDAVWVEEPGYWGARGAFRGVGARLVHVPVDAEGLDIAAGRACCASARLAYVTPSHQFPLGMTMSLARRLALLQWASQSGSWVLEDDYDSEYRYVGRPLAALQGLDSAGRVIYLGSFSKVLFMGLRLGYLVVPPDLVDTFVRARMLMDLRPPTLEQAVLTDFIVEGHFGRHLRRMRALYAERQAILVDAVQQELAGLLSMTAAESGMHLVGWLGAGVDDKVAARQAADYDVVVPPLSAYYSVVPPRGGVLLGYAAFSESEIRAGVQRLARVWTAGAAALKPSRRS
jgi:GntR family transcriptional regulator/MocR family aminotransferase